VSRGPGRVERAIEEAFTVRPGDCFTVAALCLVSYKGINEPAKRHRVAVLRAADRVAARLGWIKLTSERPGGHVVYANSFDVRSYALGRLRADHCNNDLSDVELLDLIAEPDEGNRLAHRSIWAWVQPGGGWWQHVEIAKVRSGGAAAAADQMLADHRERVLRRSAGGGR